MHNPYIYDLFFYKSKRIHFILKDFYIFKCFRFIYIYSLYIYINNQMYFYNGVFVSISDQSEVVIKFMYLCNMLFSSQKVWSHRRSV